MFSHVIPSYEDYLAGNITLEELVKAKFAFLEFEIKSLEEIKTKDNRSAILIQYLGHNKETLYYVFIPVSEKTIYTLSDGPVELKDSLAIIKHMVKSFQVTGDLSEQDLATLETIDTRRDDPAKTRASEAKGDMNQWMIASELLNSAGCSSADIEKEPFSCRGDDVLKNLPVAEGEYDYKAYKSDCISRGATAGNYCLKATGFTDGGIFFCKNGSCYCEPKTGCFR